MDIYKIKGQFKMGGGMQAFTKEIAGKSKTEVEEQLYSILGSMHGVGRRFIVIESMTKISAEEATDAVAIYRAQK